MAQAQVLSPGALPVQPTAVMEPEGYRENLNRRMRCPDCRDDPPELVEDHASGDLMCANCGLVLEERTIDQSSEWRTFSNDDQGTDDPSRVGDTANTLLNGAQLNTGIAFGDGGMRGRELGRALNKSNQDKGNKALMQAYKQIGALCDGWQLPGSVSDTAKHIYKEAEESRLFKGKSQDALIAGCIFLACRRNNVPRTFREVMELTKVSKKEVGRVFKLLENFLRRQQRDRDGQTTMVAGGVLVQTEAYRGSGTADPGDLCSRYCSMLGMDPKTTQVAILLAAKINATGSLAGRSPLSTAAACIYMAGNLMGEARSYKEIQDVAGVSDSTIRMAYKLMWGDRNKIITDEVIAKGINPEALPRPT